MEKWRMRRVELPLGILFGSFVLAIAAAWAQELPPGPNRNLVSRECQACHDVDMVAATRRSRDGWSSLLDEMAGYGMRVDPEARAKILDYLATALGPQ
jgi:hypothetical protein